MIRFPLVIITLILFGAILEVKPIVRGVPLHTDSRWIENEEGQRVKLACVNWASHLEVVVAKGLSMQPVDVISKSMGFNCVRLTWPTLLAIDDSLASLTVRDSFQNLGLLDSIDGVQSNNPSPLLTLPSSRLTRLESRWSSKLQQGKTVENDHIRHVILRILRFDGSHQGWAVISGGAEIMMAKGKGDTFLKCLNEYDQWKDKTKDKGVLPMIICKEFKPFTTAIG